MEAIDIIIKVSVFLIVTVISYNAILSGFNYGTFSSIVIAVCVAALAVVCLPEQLTVLLSEFAWGVLVLFVLVTVIMMMSVPKRDRVKRSSERYTRREDSKTEYPARCEGYLREYQIRR